MNECCINLRHTRVISRGSHLIISSQPLLNLKFLVSTLLNYKDLPTCENVRVMNPSLCP